jgi:hypothetical protein
MRFDTNSIRPDATGEPAAESETRRTAASSQGEAVARPVPTRSNVEGQGRMGWLETERLKAHAREPRIPAWMPEGAEQESESP